MPNAHAPDHPNVAFGGIGVLLVNLGTPDAPDQGSVKRYLAEFLSDRRVVELPAILWQPILRGVILNTRPRKTAHAYSQVWSDEGSPLASVTKAQARELQARLGAEIRVEYAMRYGRPVLGETFARMKQEGCDRILLAPLYPQYSAATTATVMDAIGAAMKAMRWQPALRTLPPYYDDPQHIVALRDDLSGQIKALDFAPEVLLLSFHGMPQRTLEMGDPYHCQCRKTARLVAEALAPLHPELQIEVSFQSRFGSAKWLEPSTEDTLVAQARSGTRRLAIAAPGFSADCLETHEELGIRGAELFKQEGGDEFAVLSCLNTGEAGMAMLEALVRRELAGWI